MKRGEGGRVPGAKTTAALSEVARPCRRRDLETAGELADVHLRRRQSDA